MCPFFQEISFSQNFFYKAFFYGFFFNYFFLSNLDGKKLKFDLLIKYLLLFLKNIKNFSLFVITKLLKMFYYIIFFILDSIKVIFDTLQIYFSNKFNT